MAKYYVESGNFKRIVTAYNPFDACVVGLGQHIMDCMTDPEMMEAVELEDHFMVSEKGFLSLREELTGVFEISTDEIYSTDDILREVDGQ
mgnify:CR=1 FL=1